MNKVCLINLEHVVRVVVPVTGSFPQLRVVNVWRHHLLETSLPVTFLKKMAKKTILITCAIKKASFSAD